MPNLPISQLPDATLPLSPSDLLPVVQVFTTCRAPLSALAPLGLPGPPGPRGQTGQQGMPGKTPIQVVYSKFFNDIFADITPFVIYTPPVNCLIRVSFNGWASVQSTLFHSLAILGISVGDPGFPSPISLTCGVQMNPLPHAQGLPAPFVVVAAAGVPWMLEIVNLSSWAGGIANFMVTVEVLFPIEEEFMQPTVVNALSVTGQGADIVNQILYSPPSKGLFRVSMYQTVTAISSGASAVNGDLKWTDDHGPQDAGGISSLALNAVGQVNIVYVLEAAAGTTINFQMTGGGTYGAARYSLYLVLEQIA